MQSGYYSSAAGMVAQFNRLDTISNNLANVNTTAFKEDNLVVGDFMRLYKDARDELPHENHTKEGAEFINRTMARVPHIVDAYTDFKLGNMQKTGNALDFALSKEGQFFAIETPQGIRLTRDGSFTKSDDGKLVTKQGYNVLSTDLKSINFQTTDGVISVDKDGNITNNSSLFIAQPENLTKLKKEGDNLYKYENIDSLKSIANSGSMRQGFVEKSNVNAVKMMTQLIETNRLVGMYQKAMNAQMDDMNNEAINKLAKRG